MEKGMIFSPETVAVGGSVILPRSFVDPKARGKIIGVTKAGIQVAYKQGSEHQQQAFYSFDWLNQEHPHCVIAGDMDDAIPF